MIFVAAVSALGENVDQAWSDVDGIEDEKMSNFFLEGLQEERR